MATSGNAKIQVESGQTLVPTVIMTDSGDHISFNTAAIVMSDASGKEPEVYPNGVISGGEVIPAISGTNDLVDVAEITCYLNGVLTTVSASTDETMLRGATTDTHRINSVTIDSSGAIVIISGVDHTAFSEVRGADGGPPLIPTTSIEVRQVRFTSVTAAAVDEDEIFGVAGQHLERFDFPTYEVKLVRVSNQVVGVSGVDFASALPLIHTGSVPKSVYIKYYTPIFADLAKTSDFVPAETTHSANSTAIYGNTTLVSKTQQTGQASFTAYLGNGITDPTVKYKNLKLWFKFFPDKLNATPYALTNGYLGINRKYPAGDQNQAACTITAEEATVEVAL